MNLTNVSLIKNKLITRDHFLKNSSLVNKNKSLLTLNPSIQTNFSNNVINDTPIKTNNSVNHLIKPTIINNILNHTINNTINNTINKTIDRTVNNIINNTINHSINHKISNSIHHSINFLNNETNRSINKTISTAFKIEKKARENEKLFSKYENTNLSIQHRRILSVTSIEDEIKKISSSSEFKNCLELNKFNFKSFLEVFAVIVMHSLIILLFQYLSDYTKKS